MSKVKLTIVLIISMTLFQVALSTISNNGRNRNSLFPRKRLLPVMTEAPATISTSSYVGSHHAMNAKTTQTSSEWQMSDPEVASAWPNAGTGDFTEIPLADRLKFGKEINPDEFLRKFVVNSSVSTATPGIRKQGRNGGRPGRLHTKQPSVPVCRPLPTEVPVNVSIKPIFKILPKCVIVERCGGCCNDETHVCESAESVNVTREVRLLRYIGNSSFFEAAKRNFTFQQDTKCLCNCRIKKEHCTSPHHIYVPDVCSCVCENTEEQNDCEESEDKIWNNGKCRCECKEKEKLCSSGFKYDHVGSCQCLRESESEMSMGSESVKDLNNNINEQIDQEISQIKDNLNRKLK